MSLETRSALRDKPKCSSSAFASYVDRQALKTAFDYSERVGLDSWWALGAGATAGSSAGPATSASLFWTAGHPKRQLSNVSVWETAVGVTSPITMEIRAVSSQDLFCRGDFRQWKMHRHPSHTEPICMCLRVRLCNKNEEKNLESRVRYGWTGITFTVGLKRLDHACQVTAGTQAKAGCI